jgi:transposase
LTAKGVKPICPFHQIFKTTYLFGAFSPINGEEFMIEMPNCNADNFQIFLDEFSQQNPLTLKLIVLDNGAFHKALKLIIPTNMVLIFLPPYSPELNPAEKIWAKFKRTFSNKLHKTLEEFSEFIKNEAEILNTEIVKSSCRYSYFF